jgi:4a-hydroxytetrahydrobiopterin dehydratase
MKLEKKHCKPCEGGSPSLDDASVQELFKEVPSWTIEDGKRIEKNFLFKDFKAALHFVNKVGEIAEAEGHHPDINLFNWNKVKITLSTHSIDGLSENDFILASKVDALLRD